MVLTRGCISRLTVLTGSGNLRAATVVVIFAVTAHATLKDVLSPIRTLLGTVTVNLGGYVSLNALPVRACSMSLPQLPSRRALGRVWLLAYWSEASLRPVQQEASSGRVLKPLFKPAATGPALS